MIQGNGKQITLAGIIFLFSFLLLIRTGDLSAQNVPKLSFSDLEKYLHLENDTTYVVNFWATWCAPCVKELPYFEDVNKTEFKRPVKVILVSLDFPNHFDSKLIPFIRERKIESMVLYLDDGKAHEWIPKVHKDWSGAIPATLVYNKKQRKFYEGSFIKEELDKAIQEIME